MKRRLYWPIGYGAPLRWPRGPRISWAIPPLRYQDALRLPRRAMHPTAKRSERCGVRLELVVRLAFRRPSLVRAAPRRDTLPRPFGG